MHKPAIAGPAPGGSAFLDQPGSLRITGLAATRFADMGVNLTPLDFSPNDDIIKQLSPAASPASNRQNAVVTENVRQSGPFQI
jgi:hypothetical protein